MTRHRPSVVAILVALLLTSVLAPAGVIAADPLPDGSVVAADGRVLPPLPDELNQSSVHAEMLAEGEATAPDFEPGGAPSILLDGAGSPEMAGVAEEPMGALVEPLSAAALPNGLRKEVFGFLPYWMLTDSALASMNYRLTSTIAYFSVGANRDGYLIKGSTASPSTGWAGWNSSRMTQVIDRAHASGAKVVLTVTMMAWDSTTAANQAALLGSSTARARLVSQIVGAVRARGADGVNLDFEPLATSQRARYVSFVKQLKKGLVDAGVGSYLTVCVMAGAATWATGYDVTGLTSVGAADALFVMGYDYHWSGSSRAGGVAPIQSPYTIDVAGTMADFLKLTSGKKIIWGVPYYGRTWRTNGSGLNSTTIAGESKAYTYTGSLSQASKYGRRWDDVGKVPWYRYFASGTWVQGYYDDVQSLGVKYDLINSRGMAGTGMWTLLMDQGRDELWRLLANKFVNDSAPPVGGIKLLPEVADSQTVQVGWKVIDHASGINRYNVQARNGSGSWTTWLSGTTATSGWYTGQPGATYTFRVQAIDFKGNAQPWVNVPAKPASLTPGTFAKVTTGALNVRSGASTGYGLVSTLASGDLVYLLEGPVASGGYQWYRVQYGFDEWPTSDFAQIGWMAAVNGTEPYVAPATAPTVVKLDPFVAWQSGSMAVSPNGDGVKDAATGSYVLDAAASAVRLDVLSSAGAVVRSINLGAQAAGTRSASWDGKLTSGAVAPAGTYLLRVTATDAGGDTHVGPSSVATSSALTAFGVKVDTAAPSATGAPGSGTQMVPASARLTVTFNEAVSGVSGSSLQLRHGGATLPASVTYDAASRRATLRPSQPLPTDAQLNVVLSSAIRDLAGNPVGSAGWSFRTAPGTVYAPWRSMIVLAARHTGFLVGADGDLSAPKSSTFPSPSGAKIGQRSTLPNLPGRWFHVENGVWAGYWMRESGIAYTPGQAEKATYPSSTRIIVRAGTHVGRRFDSAGKVTASKSFRLGRTSGANINGRAIINGKPYLAVINGVWAGYWLPESALGYRAGTIARLDFPGSPGIRFAAGTYTGYRYDTAGRVTGQRRFTLGRPSGADASAWAVINGRPHFLIVNGVWSGYWVPETSATTIAL